MSKFYVWIDSPTEQIETSQEFNAEPQRIRGFVKGEKISSKVNNTAIRQANLIAVALVEALGVSDNVDVSSRVSDVSIEITDKLTNFVNVKTNTKLDKVGAGSGIRLYGVTSDGIQQMYGVSYGASNGKIPMYSGNNNLQAYAPIDALHVANKNYVDLGLSKKQDSIEIVR